MLLPASSFIVTCVAQHSLSMIARNLETILHRVEGFTALVPGRAGLEWQIGAKAYLFFASFELSLFSFVAGLLPDVGILHSQQFLPLQMPLPMCQTSDALICNCGTCRRLLVAGID